MSVLVLGVSHKTAPVDVLERLALDGDGVTKLIADVLAGEHVTEAAALATCNRLEVYADVARFHGSVEEISRLLLDRATDADGAKLLKHVYVHYDDGAVSHLFQVASGLDSMVVGEGQILGQVRESLRVGQEMGSVGPALNSLFQQALRVGKRVHAETDIDRAAPSLVTAALDRAVTHVGPVSGKHVVVIGAGAMASLAISTVSRLGAADITVVNRSASNADRLASEYAARSVGLSALTQQVGPADIVISCTGASGVVLTRDQLAAARTDRSQPVAVLDLALPHDVEKSAADLPGVRLIGLRTLAEELRDSDAAREVGDVRQIVAQEVASFVAARHQASVTPTVVALRTMATGVVDAEIERLMSRLPDLDPVAREEVIWAIRRVADKLLHQPTVRVKELANETGAVTYAEALAELFALDPEAVEAVTRADGLP
ncbi:glutamyl-tRNA reductase [Nocardioides speluncae]|uniref:glutamyl-tRNA reductase n=1 Tax=Nocardioides speluncae TaxID=2670337 RepID=UPI000D68A271|nr:glutamyl-tRNA reductase [Nocardioides speluncae]